MLALIDGDIVVYRVGFTTQDVDEGLAFVRTREVLDSIILETDASAFKVFLTEESDPNAFRRKIYPEYKAHRTKPKPKWYNEIRNYMQAEFGAEICREIEADDAMGMLQYKSTPGEDFLKEYHSIICSIDKDLKQIEGLHYNFVKKEFEEISPELGMKHFYTQLLMGDSSDNIKGIPNIGPVKAARILSTARDEQSMFNVVREAYGNDEEMLMNGRVLWIWKQPNDDWKNHWDRLTNDGTTKS